ncbi:LysE/ArgO family amino acid transporter [Deferribacter thermophilus]|uniref:LysE/ArgO family amino acid transporter n=1 Tax=Deferribacter thermophilus TaxID=53573 RepID=UPI003C26963E
MTVDFATSLLDGFSLGLSLILAIGAQNAFVIKNGLLKNHIFIICLICALSDSLLIFTGISGIGYLIEKHPTLITFTKYFGVIFISFYGLMNLYSAIRKNEALSLNNYKNQTLKKTIFMTLAFTFLNPHVYLDTVLLLGSISAQYGKYKYIFGIGASLASFIFFYSIGYGSKLLAPILTKPKIWKIIEFLIGILMLFIAAKIYFM